MNESESRRIKRAIILDQGSIQSWDGSMLQRMVRNPLLADFVTSLDTKQKHQSQTNSAVFRQYMEYYLREREDLFHEGIYVGKGIIDVSGFRRALRGRVPDNALLSHDLFDGVVGRAALTSDIVVLEDFPAHYLELARRLRRWVRGDWQLLPWLLAEVPVEGGGKRADSASAVARKSSCTHAESSRPLPTSTSPWSHAGMNTPGSSGSISPRAGQPGASDRYSRPPATVGRIERLAAPAWNTSMGGDESEPSEQPCRTVASRNREQIRWRLGMIVFLLSLCMYRS